MQTQLPAEFIATDRGRRANEILRSCVHCGFCNATCPTYQLSGDELDGPRGRIYLIKELFEGAENPERGDSALGSLFDVPGLRNDLPFGGRLRRACRYRPQANWPATTGFSGGSAQAFAVVGAQCASAAFAVACG